MGDWIGRGKVISDLYWFYVHFKVFYVTGYTLYKVHTVDSAFPWIKALITSNILSLVVFASCHIGKGHKCRASHSSI